MRRIQVESLASAIIPLGAAEAHHLLRVLRMSGGTVVHAFDGHGVEAQCRLQLRDGVAMLVRTGPLVQHEVAARVHLVLAVSRGPAMDEAVRMATECGATDLHLVRTARSPPTGDRVDRWLRKATAAARQSGRTTVPALAVASSLAQALQATEDAPLWVACPGGMHAPSRAGRTAAIVVGPEGGLTPAEVEQCVDAGGRRCTLGPHILRVETAVAVGVAALSVSTGGRAGDGAASKAL
ncbi:MAG: 16S rRNA (uracil1498-N3)-methyltransferase [Myxococcota bacterium]